MALAERIYGEHKDFNGQEWRVSIYQEGWTDAAQEVDLVNPPFSITYDNTGDEVITPMKSSTCTIYFYDSSPESDDVSNLIDDMLVAEEQVFYIKILKGSSLYWCGIVLQDLFSHADTYKSVIVLQAIDGLGRLKDIPYPITFSEFETCYDQLVDLLNLNNLNQFWGATDTFIASNVNWYENQMYSSTPANTLEPLKVTRLHTDVFYQEEPSQTSGDGQRPEPETIPAYDALVNILTIFGARLHLENGRWWVLQPAEFNDANCILRTIYKDGTVSGASIYSHTVTIDQTNLVRANIGYDYLPAFKQVNILHNVRSNKLLPRNKGFKAAYSPDDDVVYTLPAIQGDNGSLLKLMYQLNVYTTTGTATPFLFDLKCEVEFKCIDSGPTTYYLRRNPTTGKAGWSTTAGFYNVFIPSCKGDDILTGEIILPEPPWTYATTNTITITFTPGTVRNGVFTARFIPLNIATWINVCVLPNGADESDVFYKADNATYPLQSVVSEIPEVLIADQSTRSQINGIEVLNTSAAWVTSANWKIGGSGTAQRLLGLLTQTTLGMQKTPVQRITGDIYIRSTSCLFANTITFNSIRYLPISLTYTPANDGVVLSGEWVAINLVTTGTTVGNSIKNFQINADVMKGLGALQRQVTAIGNALSSLMYESTVVAWLSAELSGSSITSVPTVALVDPIFKDGDTLLIISSEDESLQEEIVVDATPSDGGSSITIVSKTFTNTYPPGSQVRPKRHSIIADDVIISGMLRVDNMPTSDPGIPGQLYSDVGTIKIS